MMQTNKLITKTLDRLKKFIINKPKSIVGIDIGTSSVKIAEIDYHQSVPLLKSIGTADVNNIIDDDGNILDIRALTDTIRNLITTNGITAKDAIIAINSRKIFVRVIAFPNMTETELREAVKWDSENYVPYAPGSYYYDFSILGPGTTEMETKVLFVAAPHENVNNIVQVIKEVGLRIAAVDIEPLALYRTINGAENSAVIDIGGAMSQVILFQNGVPSVTRTIPIGGQRFTELIMTNLDLEFLEAESLKLRQKGLLRRPDLIEKSTELHQQLVMLVADIARETRRTIEYYQMQNRNAVIDKVVLSGGGAKMDNLSQHLSNFVEMPVVECDPLKLVKYASSFDKNYISELAPQLAVAIGLALRGGDQ